MDTETTVLGVDFENFVKLFYQLDYGEFTDLEDSYIRTVNTLENVLLDLDTSENDLQLIRSLLIEVLKYWEVVINMGVKELENSEIGRLCILSAIIYNFKFLTSIAQQSRQEVYTGMIARQIATIEPRNTALPDGNRADFRYPTILIEKFIQNYVQQVFGNLNAMRPNKQELAYFNFLVTKNRELGIWEETFDVYVEKRGNNGDVSFVPVEIWLDTDNKAVAIDFYTKLQSALSNLDMTVFLEYDAVKGSWRKRVVMKVKGFFSSDEFQDKLKQLNHGLDVNLIGTAQAEIDKKQAEAFAAVLNASVNIPQLVTLIGSLLIVKATDKENGASLVSRTLTTNELIFLKENQNLLKQPAQIFSALQAFNLEKVGKANEQSIVIVEEELRALDEG